MVNPFDRLKQIRAEINWATQAVLTPGHELEDPTLRRIRAAQPTARKKEPSAERVGAIVSHLHQPRKRLTRRDRFDGVTIDITPKP